MKINSQSRSSLFVNSNQESRSLVANQELRLTAPSENINPAAGQNTAERYQAHLGYDSAAMTRYQLAAFFAPGVNPNSYPNDDEYGYVLNHISQAFGDEVAAALNQYDRGNYPITSTAIPQAGAIMVWLADAGSRDLSVGGANEEGHLGIISNVINNNDGTVTLRVTEQEWETRNGTTRDGIPYRDITLRILDDGSLDLPDGVGFLNPAEITSLGLTGGSPGEIFENAAQPGQPGIPDTHTIAVGDTLWDISQSYRQAGYPEVTVSYLATVNNISNTRNVAVGRELQILQNGELIALTPHSLPAGTLPATGGNESSAPSSSTGISNAVVEPATNTSGHGLTPTLLPGTQYLDVMPLAPMTAGGIAYGGGTYEYTGCVKYIATRLGVDEVIEYGNPDAVNPSWINTYGRDFPRQQIAPEAGMVMGWAANLTNAAAEAQYVGTSYGSGHVAYVEEVELREGQDGRMYFEVLVSEANDSLPENTSTTYPETDLIHQRVFLIPAVQNTAGQWVPDLNPNNVGFSWA